MCFKNSINVTGGLPFIRVSPDHGPAFDIAKKNNASIDSIVAAFDFLKKVIYSWILFSKKVRSSESSILLLQLIFAKKNTNKIDLKTYLKSGFVVIKFNMFLLNV